MTVGMAQVVSGCLGAAIAAVAACGSAHGEDDKPHPTTSLVVSFEGGLVGDNVSDVLTSLAARPDALPMETYTVQSGDTICGVLDAKHYPQPCSKLGAFVDKLNPATRPFQRGIKQGDKVVLPAINLEPYQAATSYSKQSAQDVDILRKLTTNWKALQPRRIDLGGDRAVVEYRGYQLTIPAKDNAAATELATGLLPLQSKNVTIDVLRPSGSTSVKLNSSASQQWDHVEDTCRDGTISGSVYHYDELADADGDARAVVQAGLPAKAAKVSVYLIDVPMAASPNLVPASASGQAWTCHWQSSFKAGLHHSTHLAGIIASQQNAFGFIGLAPNAVLRPFIWALPAANGEDAVSVSGEDRLMLADVIRDNRIAKPIPVFLAAADFDLPIGAKASDPLPGPNVRFSGNVAVTIERLRPLLVVAAGQVKAGVTPHEISATAPLSPQFFGDQENVVVVTACSTCTRDDTRLMDQANYSRDGAGFVHVAAPGGADVPGWISTTEIGQTHGTSQAAAYVAGVAASMIGSFPDPYASAWAVKLRLQIASRPLPPQVGGAARPDQHKLAAGVVDPILSMLNPSKSWIKSATGWQEAKIKAWPRLPLNFSDVGGGRNYAINGSAILRMTKISKLDGGQTIWSVYTDPLKMGEDVSSGTIGRTGPVTLGERSALSLCDGRRVDLDTIDDVIPALGWSNANGCPDT